MSQKSLASAFYENNHGLFIGAMLLRVLSALEGVAVSWLLKRIVDMAMFGNMEEVGRVIGVTVLICGISFLLSWGYTALRCRFLQRALAQYRRAAYERLMGKGIRAFSQERTSRYLAVLTNDVSAMQEYLQSKFDLARMLVMGLGALGAMFLSNWWQALVVLVASLIPLGASTLLGRPLAVAQRAESDENERFVGTLKDLLSGFSVIKAFRAEEAVKGQFEKANLALEQKRYRKNWALGRLEVVGYGLCYPLVQFGVFLFMAVLAILGLSTVGTMMYFTNLVNFIVQPIQELPQVLAKQRSGRALIEKLEELLENTQDGSQGKPAEFEEVVSLDHVTVSYDAAPALEDISLTLEKGKKYALVGGSGSGKSTLLRLLMGGFAQYQGNVTIDGTELREIAPDSLYDLMGLMEQDVYLFDSSILDNLTMFQAFPRELVETAVRQGGLEALIAQKGYGYRCGENGQNLSGGQQQRVSIARSLLRGTPVLLLDEVTAALDRETAYQVTDTLLHLEGVTEVIVTHRLDGALLEQFDEIFVLKNGRLRQRGTFRALLRQEGYFRALYGIDQD